MLEEAKKRDHRKLGKELELFCLRRRCRPRSAALAPARHGHHRGTGETREGNGIRRRLSTRAHSAHRPGKHVPTSGTSLLRDSMFPPMVVEAGGAARKRALIAHSKYAESPNSSREAIAKSSDCQSDFCKLVVEARAATKRSESQQSRLRDRYYLKAMNCPHHHKLFGAVPRSYRDLPLRLAEYGTCYRYEQSGELFGLMRVRSHADERRPHLLHGGAVRGGVQCGERDVSEVFQDLRDRQISDALLHPRSGEARPEIRR